MWVCLFCNMYVADKFYHTAQKYYDKENYFKLNTGIRKCKITEVKETPKTKFNENYG